MYAVRHKVSHRFLNGSSSQKVDRDSQGLVSVDWAATYGTLAGAKSAIKSWHYIHSSEHSLGFVDFVDINDIEIVNVTLCIGEVVS